MTFESHIIRLCHCLAMLVMCVTECQLDFESLVRWYLLTSSVLKQTRNSSGDEIANVNFLYDDIVHALKIQ